MSNAYVASAAASTSIISTTYSVFVSKEDFKFNAAHFIAYEGYRERLHGHNYRVSVQLHGSVAADGYVVDFGDVKKVVRSICKEHNERFLCPEKSNVLQIKTVDANVTIDCQDGSHFSFPKSDCVMLPIMHSSAEELATYLGGRIIDEFTLQRLQERGITQLDVTVAEAPNQEAKCCMMLPATAKIPIGSSS
jgi:6-pyruvoyltetrahydropterin/6-carboxytetrahydropterin synthase